MQIIKLNAIDSTNRYLADYVSNIPLKDYAVVMAQYQSAGQGQRGSNWQSEKGKNLIISILKKNIKTKVQDQFEINMRISMAVLITLNTFGIPNLSVKWPNDILSDNKKISGVLIQLIVKKEIIKQAIIGIGINVNQTHFNNLPQASSMKSITGTAFDIEALTTELMTQLKHYFDVTNTDKLMTEYESVLFRKNKPSTFVNIQGVSFVGTIQGVSKRGMLRVKSEKVIEEFDLKSIQMIY
jgi:BirA family biotin operon repressor/biotin-[acetyl-CoA-carboxylase] ligase|tara:strand:- start:1041 stop:1760 length:720 start_codon:yes stop_codon:yes gene_type:complete